MTLFLSNPPTQSTAAAVTVLRTALTELRATNALLTEQKSDGHALLYVGKLLFHRQSLDSVEETVRAYLLNRAVETLKTAFTVISDRLAGEFEVVC